MVQIVLACALISTHAPTRGATSGGTRCWRIGRYHFYSRPYARGDTPIRIMEKILSKFLLTPLREGRHKFEAQLNRDFQDFYSRPYARGDLARLKGLRRKILFLLTPLREGRQKS